MSIFKKKYVLGFRHVSRLRYVRTMTWAVFLSGAIVGAAALLGRATLNLNAALTDKPDLAVFVLLRDDGITSSVFLRERKEPFERDYLTEVKNGPLLVRLRKTEDGEWKVVLKEPLHH